MSLIFLRNNRLLFLLCFLVFDISIGNALVYDDGSEDNIHIYLDLSKTIQQDESLFQGIKSKNIIPFGIDIKIIDRISIDTMFVGVNDSNNLSLRMSMGVSFYTQSFTGLYFTLYPVYDLDLNTPFNGYYYFNMAIDMGLSFKFGGVLFTPYLRFPIFNYSGYLIPLIDAGVKMGFAF